MLFTLHYITWNFFQMIYFNIFTSNNNIPYIRNSGSRNRTKRLFCHICKLPLSSTVTHHYLRVILPSHDINTTQTSFHIIKTWLHGHEFIIVPRTWVFAEEFSWWRQLPWTIHATIVISAIERVVKSTNNIVYRRLWVRNIAMHISTPKICLLCASSTSFSTHEQQQTTIIR